MEIVFCISENKVFQNYLIKPIEKMISVTLSCAGGGTRPLFPTGGFNLHLLRVIGEINHTA